MKYKCFSLTVYTLHSIQEALHLKRELITHWSYIKHDSDKWTKEDEVANPENKEGEFKKLHFHVLIKTRNPYSPTTVRNWFKNPDGLLDGLCEGCQTPLAMFEYFTHKNNPERYQYSESDIVADDIDHWKHDKDSDKLQEALLEMLEGVDLVDLVKKYGRDFIIHYRSVKMLVEDIRNYNLERKINDVKN